MTSLYRADRDKVARFESPEAFHEYQSSIKLFEAVRHRLRVDSSFFGPQNYQECMNILTEGDTSTLEEAQKIIDQLSDAHLLTLGQPTLQPSVVGYVPLVPAVLAGMPECMLRRQESDMSSDHAPITIYFSTNVSAKLSRQQVMNRGIAVLGLTLALSSVRPIDLYAVTISNPTKKLGSAYGVCVKIETKPLDLGRAAWMMTSAGYARRLGLAAVIDQAGELTRPGIPFAWNLDPTSDQYRVSMRDMLGCEPDDIYISPGFISDKLMLNDPVEWVRQMIEKHAHSNANEAAQ